MSKVLPSLYMFTVQLLDFSDVFSLHFNMAKAEVKICFSRVQLVPHYAHPLSVHCFALIARHLLWHEAMDSCSDVFELEDWCFSCDPAYNANTYIRS